MAKPFVKWVGGKRQLLAQYQALGFWPNQFDSHTHTYFEPFVGGGAVFFHFAPKQAVLSDLNTELINAYRQIRDNCEELIFALKFHVYDKDYYLSVRQQDPNQLSPLEAASRFIYLNRTGFNGLYRVNKRGQFNVPFGRYTNPVICDETNLRAVSQALATVQLNSQPYQAVLEQAKAGDFIYFDPPYYPLNATSSFTSYTQAQFLATQQQELCVLLQALSARGCFVALSNSDTDFTRELYQSLVDFKLHSVKASRAINAKALKRGKVGELLLKNY